MPLVLGLSIFLSTLFHHPNPGTAISLSVERNVWTSRYGRSIQQHGAVGNLVFCCTQTNSYVRVFSINGAIQLSLLASCVRRSKAERPVTMASLKLVHSLFSHLTADGFRACHCRFKFYWISCSSSTGHTLALQYRVGACRDILELGSFLGSLLSGSRISRNSATDIVQCLLLARQLRGLCRHCGGC